MSDEEELDAIEIEAKEVVRNDRQTAWANYLQPIKNQVERIVDLLSDASSKIPEKSESLNTLVKEITAIREPMRRDVMRILNLGVNITSGHDAGYWLKQYYADLIEQNKELYNSHLYNEGPKSALNVRQV